MGEHTPGPWTVGFVKSYGWPCFRIRDMVDHEDRSEILANAHLIAAAPDLLAACQAWEVVREMDTLYREGTRNPDALAEDAIASQIAYAEELTQAAIAKARGE